MLGKTGTDKDADSTARRRPCTRSRTADSLARAASILVLENLGQHGDGRRPCSRSRPTEHGAGGVHARTQEPLMSTSVAPPPPRICSASAKEEPPAGGLLVPPQIHARPAATAQDPPRRNSPGASPHAPGYLPTALLLMKTAVCTRIS
jgi:hypothetical protein